VDAPSSDNGRTWWRDAGTALRLAWAGAPLAIVLAFVATLVAGAVPAATAWITRLVIDDLASPAAGGVGVVTWALILGATGVLASLTAAIHRYVDDGMRLSLGANLEDRLCRALGGYHGLQRFEDPRFVDHIALAHEGGRSAPARLVGAMLSCLSLLVTAIGLFWAIGAISPALAAVVIGTAIPTVVAQLRLGRQRASLHWRISPGLRRQFFYRGLQSDPVAAKEVKLFGLGDFLRGRMLTELRFIHRQQRALDRRELVADGSLSLISTVVTAVGLVWTVSQASAGQLSAGDVSLFILAAAGMQGALAGLVGQVAQGYESALMLGHYMHVVESGPDLPVATHPVPVGPLRHGVELRDVWFRYDPSHPWVLRGVSMFIPQGSSVGLVGLNGAGKSTVAKLICRLYDPDRGSIVWDGQDIREMAPADLRRRIGAVFQDYMAYDLTAADNIGVGDVERLDDQAAIRRAAELADVHRYVADLPHGYRTMLSRTLFDDVPEAEPESGVILSGGQWQRLALARGLMRRDRDFLILDEPNAGLDAEAEHDIHVRLAAMRAGRATLLISHRLSSLRDAEMIYVLADGVIAESGTHHELMASNGGYQRLFRLQARGYQDAGSAVPVAPGG
jgi:ATP-binding cassette, subfamily B, bacterial